MRTSRSLAIIAVLATLTLAGCGTEEGESPTGTTSDRTTQSGGEDASTVLDICSLVTEAEVSSVLGGSVTSEEVPGGGCNFANEDDPRAASLQVVASALDESTGGFEGSIAGVSGALQGDAGAPVDGVGDRAYLKTGTFGGSDFVRGSGLVQIGSTVVQVDLSPDEGTSATDVEAIVLNALELVAGKA